MRKQLFVLLLLSQLTITKKTFSQNIAINATGSLPDTSAMLDVSSTVKGFLSPRMTTGEQNAIPLPATGLLVYNTTTGSLNVNTGTPASPSWTALATGVTSSGGGWGISGNSNTNASSNYIGTSNGQALVFKVNGAQAGYLGLAGSSNATAFGLGALAGFGGTAIGSGARANSSNEAVGFGYNANAGGYRSIAIGASAKASTTTSINETIAIGYNASANSYQGIAIGSGAGTSTNNNSIAVGVSARATGFQSAAIGNGATATAQNSTAIGNGASVSTANYIAIGNSAVSAIRGQVNFTTYSDGRFKRDIKADVPGLDFILNLRPVTYHWDIHQFNAHSRGTDFKTMQVKYTEGDNEAAILKKESIQYTGFIAQEVEQAAKNCQFNFSGVLKPVDDKDAYSLSYAAFVVPLVKSTQELNNKIAAQQKIIDQLMKAINELKEKIK